MVVPNKPSSRRCGTETTRDDKSMEDQQGVCFYWNRPLGAPTSTFRLSAASLSLSRSGKRRNNTTWTLPIPTVEALVETINDESSIDSIELEGELQAWEAVSVSDWTCIQNAVTTALDNSTNNKGLILRGPTNEQVCKLLKAVLVVEASCRYRCFSKVDQQRYSIRLYSSDQQSSWQAALAHLVAGRDRVRELHLVSHIHDHEPISLRDAVNLAAVLRHCVRSVSLRNVRLTMQSWQILYNSLQENIHLEHVNFDIHFVDDDCDSVDWQVCQQEFDWNARLHTVRRSLLKADLPLSQSFVTRRAVSTAERERAAAAKLEVETQHMKQIDAAVVVLKDWWRSTHLPLRTLSTKEREAGANKARPSHNGVELVLTQQTSSAIQGHRIGTGACHIVD